LEQRSWSVALPVPAEQVFAYHDSPGALDRLLPPWQPVRIADRATDGLNPGSKVRLQLRLAGFKLDWLAEHTVCQPPHRFCDIQVKGPFAAWEHEHSFETIGSAECRMTDRIQYRLPGGTLGQYLGGGKIERDLDAMFAYRHRTTRDDLRLAAECPAERPQRIAVSGGSGFLGRRVISLLSVLGHQVYLLRRPGAKSSADLPQVAGHIDWDPKRGLLVPTQAERLDGMLHLAGKGIADQRWSPSVQREIVDSRVDATRRLVASLASLSEPPRVWVSASATGYYGDRADQLLDESSPAGSGFLAETCTAWEEASRPMFQLAQRCCWGRLGVVLGPEAGALPKLLTPFRLGVGGRVGSGRQYWSWIERDDAAAAFVWMLLRPQATGTYNLVSPEPLTNDEFSRTLARLLHRPSLLPAPAIALRCLLGEMAQHLLLASARVAPSRLLEDGFRFRHRSLDSALRHLLGLAAHPTAS
jgi:uncharacterized protein (TIGR01777 family)